MIPLVLLPGMMCDSRLFAPQILAITDRTVLGYSITAHDTIEALAADILSHAPERFILGGLSMGGIVAMEMVRQTNKRKTNKRIIGLCLMDTNPLAEQDAIKKRRNRQIKAVRAGKLIKVMRDEMKPNYLYNSEARKDQLDLCMKMARTIGSKAFVRQSHALQNRADQTKALKQYRNPTLILHGAHDGLCPPERHHLLQELIPHAELHEIAEAGHLPTLEQPDSVNKILLNWLAELTT